ncbi:ABC transporter ATP-binding protein [Planktomarina sp.]|jgi:oligopeptide/dipeptide ABC transporter ATP-binding protein|nr:ABC transporter ATP-binding protein [Planktomarina sp.]|tara:strand:- start:2071 stop:3339 length:1269 start_codon:yes stop_codon:yes gene_type:complete
MSAVPKQHPSQDVLLSIRDVKKHYPIRDGALQRVVGSVRAVDGVSFDIRRGETVGLVGESGCGKTTLGRVISGLSDPTGGGVLYNLSQIGLQSVDGLQDQASRLFRRNCQMVFQDSFASLNPRHLVVDIVGRPLKVYKEASGSALTEKVVELLEQVGLGRQHLYRYPHQFSGGQRQRISIARALALDPEIIVLDEPTSALDVSVQAQILNLLNDLQKERNLAYLFITHDLSVVRHMADRLVVMYLGKVSEAGVASEIFKAPHHPYTKALMDSKPDLYEDRSETHTRGLGGIVPDPARPPQGCRFHTRCQSATPSCGWEVDDVIGLLEENHGIFEFMNGVERKSAFEAELSFDNEEAAGLLAMALRSEQAPEAMKKALIRLQLNGNRVNLSFDQVDEVPLIQRAGGRESSCLLDPDEISIQGM